MSGTGTEVKCIMITRKIKAMVYETNFSKLKGQRIVEYLKLKETHNDCRQQLPAPLRAT